MMDTGGAFDDVEEEELDRLGLDNLELIDLDLDNLDLDLGDLELEDLDWSALIGGEGVISFESIGMEFWIDVRDQVWRGIVLL